MKATGIMVGNYHETQCFSHPRLGISSIKINDKCFSQITAYGIFRVDSGEMEFKPIQLTKEWLLKFGFSVVHEKNQHYAIQDPNGFKDMYKISVLKSIDNIWQIAFSDILNGYKDYIPTTVIRYVHQLQNLFLCLTGEELTLK